MSNKIDSMLDLDKGYDVAIIGSGPAGLSTAIALKKLGVKSVVVLERYGEAGGNPRHCGHSPFGMREFKRVFFGPQYAKKLVKTALENGVKIALNTTVTSFEKGGLLTLSTKLGMAQLQAKKVVLSTGIRETPRSARLISGQRPLGIMTAGALQSMVYLSDNKPFKKPVIIGSELVSFSSIATCKHAKIKPVAMIEENDRPTAWSFLKMYPALMGVKFLSKTQLVEIHGKKRVTGVSIINSEGKTERLECDGVIFSGKFIPEATLVRLGHLKIDSKSNGPVVDQFSSCSDPDFFACGNVLRPVETAGWCWKEGVETAQNIVDSMSNKQLRSNGVLNIDVQSPEIKYCLPQMITLPTETGHESLQTLHLQIRVTKPVKGRIVVGSRSGELYSKNINALPERRILLTLSKEVLDTIKEQGEDLAIHFQA